MFKYKVSIARVEHIVYHYEVEAKTEDEAESLAQELFDDGDLDKGEVVFGESFVNQVDLIKENENV